MSSASVILFVVACSFLLAGYLAQPTSRILGGDEADTTSFPYMVSVRMDSAHVCGGSIVGERYILTAAHCVSELKTTPVDSSRVSIRAGSTNQFAGGKIYLVKAITINPGYSRHLNDVAVLELQTALDLGTRVKIIPMAESADAVDAGDEVVVAGWGKTSSDGVGSYKLNYDHAEVISQEDCEEAISYGYASTLCLQAPAQKGSCQGDAGGPAVFNDVLVGVSNFVIGACGTAYPDVFARVAYFSSWVNSVMNGA